MKQRFKFYDEQKPANFIIGNVDPAHINDPKINSQIYAKFNSVYRYNPRKIKAVKAPKEDALKSPNNTLANIVAREIYKVKPGSTMPDIYQSLKVENNLSGYDEVYKNQNLKKNILSSINSLPYNEPSKQTLIALLERKIKESQSELPSPPPSPGPQPQPEPQKPEPSPFVSDQILSSNFTNLNNELRDLLSMRKDSNYIANFPAQLAEYRKKLDATRRSGNIDAIQYESFKNDLVKAQSEYDAFASSYK